MFKWPNLQIIFSVDIKNKNIQTKSDYTTSLVKKKDLINKVIKQHQYSIELRF